MFSSQLFQALKKQTTQLVKPVRTYIAATITRTALPTRLETGRIRMLKNISNDSQNSSQKWVDIFTINNSYKTPTISLSNILYSQIDEFVYSIKDADWNGFIDQLPEQEVIRLLNLKEHRHLWPAYNFALDSSCNAANYNETAKLNRARYIGQFHFLLTYLKNSADEELQKVDQGVPLKEILKPHFTNRFLERMAHADNWFAVELLHREYILPRAINPNIPSTINLAKLHESISVLPSSRKDPHNFKSMLDDLWAINFSSNLTNVTPQTRAEFLYQCRTGYGLFKQIGFKSGNMLDYFNAITNDLIYPAWIRSKINLGLPTDDDTYRAEQGADKVMQIFSKFLAEHYRPAKLVSLEKKWHRNVTVIERDKPISTLANEWYPLCADQHINGIHFKCLYTSADLKKEGETMLHCVGGYSKPCLEGTSQIFSVTTADGARATLELGILNHNPPSVHLLQLKGIDNKAVDARISEAVNQFINLINSNQIQINKQRGRVKATDDSTVTGLIHNIYPYDVHDDPIQEQIYQAYVKANALPNCLIANTYQEALEKSGLNQLLSDSLAELYSNQVSENKPAKLTG